MKRKIILTGALILIIGLVILMGWDLFFSKSSPPENPYEYDLTSLRTADNSLIRYEESHQIKPGLTGIRGIATDLSGKIYVTGESGVEIFDSSGKRFAGFSTEGIAKCIHVDPSGNIYLGIQDHIEIYNNAGKLLKKWKSCGENAIVTSIAVGKDAVFVADAGNKIVHHYDLAGSLKGEIGQKDPEKGIPGFVIPSPYFDLGINRNGELWVVNPGRHAFEQYSPEGDLIKTWGKATMAMEGFCGCCNPSHFAFLSDGSIVTSEKGIERIKIYRPDGDFIAVVATPASFSEGTTGLDLAVDSKNRILVLDPEKNLIRIFTEKMKH